MPTFSRSSLAPWMHWKSLEPICLLLEWPLEPNGTNFQKFDAEIAVRFPENNNFVI